MRAPTLIGVCLGVLISPVLVSAQHSGEAGHVDGKVPSQLRIPAILKVSLSSKKAKVGDPVRLEVAADVHDARGTIVLPRRARLTGRVTHVVPYQKKQQAAMLSFTVDRAEWKEGSASLDAPIYGADILETDSVSGEMVGELRVASLGVESSVNIVSMEVESDTRVGAAGSSGYAHAIRDQTFHRRIMQLKRVPDPAIKSAFVKEDGDLQVPSEFVIVMMNDMQAVQ